MGVTHAHLGPIWYHSKPSDGPYSPNQFLGLYFFAVSYSKPALVISFSGNSAQVCIRKQLGAVWLGRDKKSYV